ESAIAPSNAAIETVITNTIWPLNALFVVPIMNNFHDRNSHRHKRCESCRLIPRESTEHAPCHCNLPSWLVLLSIHRSSGVPFPANSCVYVTRRFQLDRCHLRTGAIRCAKGLNADAKPTVTTSY